MRRVERYVIRGVKVLGTDLQSKGQRRELVNDRRNLSSASYCQRTILWDGEITVVSRRDICSRGGKNLPACPQLVELA
jgi:hypothetical protein